MKTKEIERINKLLKEQPEISDAEVAHRIGYLTGKIEGISEQKNIQMKGGKKNEKV